MQLKQLVRFSTPSSSPIQSSAPIFLFEGQSLSLAKSAWHLGHILRSDLCDTDDILRVQSDMCRRAVFFLLSMLLTLLSGLLFSKLSVCPSMALLSGACLHPVCALWRLRSTTYCGRYGNSQGSAIHVYCTASVAFRASTTSFHIAQ